MYNGVGYTGEGPPLKEISPSGIGSRSKIIDSRGDFYDVSSTMHGNVLWSLNRRNGDEFHPDCKGDGIPATL